MGESRDPQAASTDVWGLLTFSAALFLIVFGVLRGNDNGWSSGLILGSLVGGAVLLSRSSWSSTGRPGRCST